MFLDGNQRGFIILNPISNFKFTNCLFGVINVVKNSDKEK